MRRDLWLQGVAIVSLTVSLAIAGSYFTLCFNLNRISAQLATGPGVTMVLTPGTSPAQVRDLLKEVSTFPEVDGAVFIPKAQALSLFSKQLGPHKSLLQGLQENPLPDTLELRLKPGRLGDEFITKLRGLPAVAEVLSSRPWLHRLEKAEKVLYELASAVGLLLFFGVVLLVANTVRLAVYVRSSQLEVMELVGASLGYIRRPFLLEAVIQGLIAAGLASLLIWGILNLLGAPAALPLGLDMQLLLDFSWPVPAALAALAIMAGLAGGYWGVGRSLRARGL
jgi:cell division transport system permease protein